MWRYLLALVFLAGCAHTPKDVRERGDRFELRSSAAAKEAAACMTRAIENANGNIRAQWRERSGGYEVVADLIRSGIILVADVSPSGSGSMTAGYFDRETFYYLRDELIAAMRTC